MHEAALQRQGFIPFADVLGEIAQQAAAVDLAKQRRRLAHHYRAGAERLDDQAVSASSSVRASSRSTSASSSSTTSGISRICRATPVLPSRSLQRS